MAGDLRYRRSMRGWAQPYRTISGRRTPEAGAHIVLKADGRLMQSEWDAAWCLSLELRDHSPTGPEWGYNGSGPSQLALALLMLLGYENREALGLYQEFKAGSIALLPKSGWHIGGGDVHDAVRRIKNRRQQAAAGR